MTDNFFLPLAAAFFLFTTLEIAAHFMRSRSAKSAQDFLRLAKQETLETAQISLGNPYPLIQVSADGRVIFMNPAAFECFPGLREQGIRHPVLRNLPTFEDKKVNISREIIIDKKVYSQTIAPTQINGQAALTIYCYDVTERKAYEQKLKQSREEAEKARRDAEAANQARGDFLANMSHELRTPMNGIIGLSDILIEAGLKPEHQEMIEAVNSSAHNLLILLNDILDFSKIEAGELTLESIPFDLRKTVRQIEALQSPVAARKGLAMKCVIDKAVPPYLLGDPSRLQQVLNNLIGNALKFTEKGFVTISVGGQCDCAGNFIAVLAVKDTGIGIPQNRQDNLFKKFQQADTSTSRKYGGTGLGLAISKNLVTLMGGTIALESKEGEGTTFTVSIPVPISKTGVAHENSCKTGVPSAAINRKAKIMVVDDHPVNLLFMRQIMKLLGMNNFTEATSGRQAIEMLRREPYDLILMDCQMPDMDGYEASSHISQIADLPRKPIIIAVTANAMKGAEEKCKTAGMDDYISKPVDKDRLKDLLQRWIPADRTQNGETQRTRTDSPSPACAIFDWEHLLEYTSGDKETENMLIDMFMQSLKADINKLQSGFCNGNFSDWEATAHKMHGASAHMGAYALANICDQAQSIAEGDREAMKGIHMRIIAETQKLYGLLDKYRNQKAA